MDVSTIADTTSTVAERRATSRGFDDLSSEDFFGLLIAELQSQNPLEPKDNEQILSQMSNIRQMEQSAKLNETLDALAGEQRFGATSSLIGHYIAGTVTDQAGVPTEIQGLVIGVRFEGDNAILELHDGQAIPADKVEQVTLIENLPPEILEELQKELEATQGTGETQAGEEASEEGGSGGDGEDAQAAARSIFGSPAGQQPTVGAHVREFGRRANIVGDLLDSLLSPGVGIKVGS
ncbi:MAG: hypothetical protein MI923_13555 [Phycisphaerales bacterium]|nr:hypothetical protein [Phycisphaerales bacterium]